jgi:hypothetical protein
MAALLPNFPPDVLGQWFYDHWMQIGDNSWLDYPSLIFELQDWSFEAIPRDQFGHEELLTSRARYFAEEIDLPERFTRLLDYIRANGTWPRPIIVLDTATQLLERPVWLSSGPYNLLEGHNRVAGLRYLQRSITPLPTHKVWLVSRPSAS